MRPCNNRKIKGNRFLLSTFYGSSACTERAWGMKLDSLFLPHPMVEREDVEIAALHLEGEANIWWFGHLTAFADFTQRLIKKFDKKESEENMLSPPLAVGALA